MSTESISSGTRLELRSGRGALGGIANAQCIGLLSGERFSIIEMETLRDHHNRRHHQLRPRALRVLAWISRSWG
ncbi:hypothetical protein [Mycolicibacterium sp. ELW1-p]|uniref:hypothetical protein n=1 Tax=Mycolicibacterium sp. ELW1-p TaxID=3434945 RepID=UPI003D813B5F